MQRKQTMSVENAGGIMFCEVCGIMLHDDEEFMCDYCSQAIDGNFADADEHDDPDACIQIDDEEEGADDEC